MDRVEAAPEKSSTHPEVEHERSLQESTAVEDVGQLHRARQGAIVVRVGEEVVGNTCRKALISVGICVHATILSRGEEADDIDPPASSDEPPRDSTLLANSGCW